MKTLCSILAGLMAVALAGCGDGGAPAVKVGLNTELTGEMPAVGASSQNAADLFVSQVNAAGGVPVGAGKLPIKLIVGDNGAKADQAAAVAQRLITQDEVAAMIGPDASVCAIPAADIAEAAQCVMISPWSTNPKTTLDPNTSQPKDYVFRACFTDTFQAGVLAKFVLNNLNAKTAAVLFDSSSEAPNGQATLFKETFEKNGGKIVGFETYTTGDKDFSAQLTKLKASNPEVIFLPAYYNDVPLIAQQARGLGITAQFVGSDAWSSPELIKLGRDAIEGSFFCNHYSTQIATPVAQKFMADYKAKYGQEPDDVAALTYDAFGLLVQAITEAGSTDRQAIRAALAKIPKYEGITGTMQFQPGSGDPIKSAVILQIKDGKFVWVANAQP
ncbi:MAG TPA: ABC transporter substrate-binding protein [Terrimicrobiaceae bacterium]|nr:ABC transporter substrate-binding protein [Terrimicrobiaceae bacterium]